MYTADQRSYYESQQISEVNAKQNALGINAAKASQPPPVEALLQETLNRALQMKQSSANLRRRIILGNLPAESEPSMAPGMLTNSYGTTKDSLLAVLDSLREIEKNMDTIADYCLG